MGTAFAQHCRAMDLDTFQGAHYLGAGQTRFRVWAPYAKQVDVHLTAPEEKVVRLQPVERGYHEAVVEKVEPGTRYLYLLDGKGEFPDPASRLQPEGPHKPSEVVNPEFSWSETHWTGLALNEYVFYELHVGTFTPEGTFESAIGELERLKDLGVTCLELMPIAQFPGGRNWGYDGTYPYAAQSTYGGPQGLKRLVDAAHRLGMAVCLDVVYNHLGPEGNYLLNFGPYFSDSYKTPWGMSLNWDGPGSDEVREYFIGNALYWTVECRIDALRLDAVHAIIDTSAHPCLAEMARRVHAASARLGRRIHLIAENDRNDPAFARPAAAGGYGLDAQWNDDFHHALHTVLTKESHGYYSDYGHMEHLARALTEGYVYGGHYSPHRNRSHGAPPDGLNGERFVVCSQNHDQVGNRMLGERLSSLVGFPQLKLAAAAVLFSPYLPLLFMGEEYGEPAPFLYFVSHGDPDLLQAVSRGRREEFAAFHALGEAPDPASQETFERSRINPQLRHEGTHGALHQFYRELLRLRRQVPALGRLDRFGTKAVASEHARTLTLLRGSRTEHPGAVALFNFSEVESVVRVSLPAGAWLLALDSEDQRWGGRGGNLPARVSAPEHESFTLHPLSVALYLHDH